MGNKISIKDKFESFITLSSDNILPSLEEILTQKLSDEDIKLGILPNTIRKFITDNESGFTTTLTKCINHLYFVTSSEKVLSNDSDIYYLNNVLMFVIRFLPVLHEPTYRELIQKIMWTETAFPQELSSEMKIDAFLLNECLAIKLMTSLFKLMFYPDFTILTKKSPEPQRIKLGGLIAEERLLWRFYNPNRNDNDNVKFFYNRSKVLECLLACFSSPIFYALNSKDRSGDPWINFCISKHNPLLATAMISWINLGLSYEENSLIPYTQYLVGDGGGEKLALLCLQLVCLFADVRVGVETLQKKVVEEKEYQQVVRHYLKIREKKGEIEKVEIEDTQNIAEILVNASLVFLQEFRSTEYYDFISLNILRVLRNPYDADNSYLIESRKKTALLDEVLLVFWRLLENNKTYVQRFFYQQDFLPIVIHLLYQIHESFTSAARSNIFYLAVILLSKLSCDRLFAVQLKKKYKNDIGFTRIPIFIGSHLDLLFIIFTNGIIDSYTNNYFCYQNNLLAILHNVAPFAKDLSPITTSLLVQLVTSTARPKVLRSDKHNLFILRKALNLIHKILCYQPETCINLLYELLAEKKELELLKILPLKQIYNPKPKTANQSKVGDQSKVEEEEKGENAEKSQVQEPKSPEPQAVNPSIIQVQLFDDKWMEIYLSNLANDMIFVVIDYLQEQMKQILRERANNSEEEIKLFLGEQSILGIVPQPGPIMIEVVNDPENIDNNLYIFLWQQIFLKHQGLPYFDTEDVRLLNSPVS